MFSKHQLSATPSRVVYFLLKGEIMLKITKNNDEILYLKNFEKIHNFYSGLHVIVNNKCLDYGKEEIKNIEILIDSNFISIWDKENEKLI